MSIYINPHDRNARKLRLLIESFGEKQNKWPGRAQADFCAAYVCTLERKPILNYLILPEIKHHY